MSAAANAEAQKRAFVAQARQNGGPGAGGTPRGARTNAALVLLRRAMPGIGMRYNP
ncbi:MAG: hypothetical protein ABR949_08420 [Candidatus Aquilonibacter sp.]